MTNNIVFGIVLTYIVFSFSKLVAKKTKLTLLNPLLVSSLIVIVILIGFNIPYDNYNKGGQLFTYLITPATVSLAIPLYKNFDTLKNNKKMIGLGVCVAIIAHFSSLVLMYLLFNSNLDIAMSLIPKSITTAFAKDISTSLGGIEIVTVSVVIVTGIFGATVSPLLNKLFKFKDDRAIGLALGSSAHAIGTSKAVENNEIQATFSSLALILTGILTVLLSPLLAWIATIIL